MMDDDGREELTEARSEQEPEPFVVVVVVVVYSSFRSKFLMHI
jgi:hypothetical protein